MIDFWPKKEFGKAFFPPVEYHRRREKAKKLMEEHNIDAMFVTEHHNVEYYTGYRKTAEGIRFPRPALIPLDGDPVMIMPLLFAGIAREASGLEVKIWGGGGPPTTELGYEEDYVKFIAKTFEEMGLQNKVIATELGGDLQLGMAVNDLERLKGMLPNAKFVDSSGIIWNQRIIKTPEEIKAIRRLCEITVEGWRSGFESIRVGMAEKDIIETIWHKVISMGGYLNRMGGSLLLHFGSAAETGRFSTFGFGGGERRIREGDQGISDAGPCYTGYYTDTQRRISIGEPSERDKEMVEMSIKGLEKAEEMMTPGITIREIYEEVSKYEYKRTFPHLGHGVGLIIHEPPFMFPGSPWYEMKLEPGMFLAIEPTVTDWPELKHCIASIEDNILITEHGCENLTKDLDRELWIIRC